MNNYIIIGDSITYGIGDYDELGWATMFKKYVVKKDSSLYCTNFVHIAGYPGATSYDILQKLDSIYNSFEDKYFNNIVILSIGINDTQFSDQNINLSLDNYKKNIETIIDKTKKRGFKLYILGLTRMSINENDVDDSKYYDATKVNDFYHDLELINNYDAALEEVCKQNNIKYISLSNLLSDEDYLDCLHPTSTGHKKIFDILIKEIEV